MSSYYNLTFDMPIAGEDDTIFAVDCENGAYVANYCFNDDEANITLPMQACFNGKPLKLLEWDMEGHFESETEDSFIPTLERMAQDEITNWGLREVQLTADSGLCLMLINMTPTALEDFPQVLRRDVTFLSNKTQADGITNVDMKGSFSFAKCNYGFVSKIYCIQYFENRNIVSVIEKAPISERR